MSEIWRKLLCFFRRDRLDREIEEEMRFHLDMNAADYGTDAARRQFGNVTLLREESHAAWIFGSFERFGQDLRYAARMLSRSPGLTIAAVASLALGIGADTALFSVMDGMWFRPLAIQDPSGLVRLFTSTKEHPRGDMSYADYRDIATSTRTLASLAASQRRGPSLGINGVTETTWSEVVSENYFTALGVEAALGRVFREQSQPEQTLVISHNLWQRRFGGDPAIIGTEVELSGRPFVVVGVAPKEFRGIELWSNMDLWVPLSAWSPDEQFDRRIKAWTVVGRVGPGVTLQQARGELSSIARGLALAHPETNKDRDATVLSALDYQLDQAAAPALILVSIVGILLCIACANVANLLLARGEARRREIAIRLAVGCGRRRLVRQLLTESCLLALAGAFAALLLAACLIRLLPAILPSETVLVRLDHRVLAFTSVTTLITGMLFGLVPALRASRPDVAHVLKREAPPGKYRSLALRDCLVVAQMAFSMLLLAGAGLLVRSFLHSQHLDLGFGRKNALIVSLYPGLPEPQARPFYRQLVERVRALPGVRQVGLVHRAPLWPSEGGVTTAVTVPGHPSSDPQAPFAFKFTTAGDNYFRTMGIPLLRGRDFNERDNAAGPPVAIVNETMARRFWPGEDPIGRTIVTGKGDQRQIVGVVKDTKINHVLEDAEPYLYLPFGQSFAYSMSLVVEASGDPLALADPIKSEIRALVNAPVPEIEALQSLIRRSTSEQESGAIVVSAFGLLGILLAGAGLFGVMAFVVARRTQEIGIRMALGADKRATLALVLRRSLALAGTGALIGLAGAVALSRQLSSVLVGVSPHDPIALGSACMILLTVALLASLLPAVRASNTNPTDALRHE